MLLCIDIGNSYVKAAYHDGKTWQHAQRCTLTEFCDDPKRLAPLPASCVAISNVAGTRVEDPVNAMFNSVPVVWLKATPSAAGVINGYANPVQLGVDRWSMLVAAQAIYGGPCVIAAAGTALTVDLLSSQGEFLGGVIAPGLELMRRALALGTDAVQPASGAVVELPNNTADAVESGLHYAMRGVIVQATQVLEARERSGIHYLMTGGNASIIAPQLNRPFQVVDNLVLEGIRILVQQKGTQ